MAESRGGWRGGRTSFRGRNVDQGRGSNVFAGRCYNCGEFGHPYFKCPKIFGANSSGSERRGEKRVQIVQEDEEETVNSSSHNCAPEVGETLMIQRQLLKASKEKEPLQRRNIFETTCKSKGKVCKLVIDSGSTNNIVSREMVDKLSLIKFPHQTPYKVSWLNDDQSLIVNENSLVKFQIGGYKDRVLCDVLPMKCCHLLLGRS